MARNSFPGICYRCKKMVNPMDGHFERIPFKKRSPSTNYAKWLIQHASCAIEFRGTDVGKIKEV